MQTKANIAPEVLAVLEATYGDDESRYLCLRCLSWDYTGKSIDEAIAHMEACCLDNSMLSSQAKVLTIESAISA